MACVQVKMVEESRVCSTSGQQDMEAPPRKRSKLSLSSRRKDDSCSAAVKSTQEPVYPLFQLKGTDSSTIPEKSENSHVGSVESDPSSVVLDMPTDPSCDIPAVMSSYSYGEFVPFVGLTNLHNTCYINSVLQILMHTPEFALRLAYLQRDLRDIYVEARASFNKTLKQKFSEPDFGLLNELCRLFRKVGTMKMNYLLAPEARKERLAIEPIRTLDAIKDAHAQFRGSLQHDAQEFLRCVLSSLQDANAAILLHQGERRAEIRRRQEKLAAIMAKKEATMSKKEATMIKYLPDPQPDTQNGVHESKPSNGAVVQGSPVEKAPKPKRKRLGVGHSRNQIKITRFASPSDPAPRVPVNGQNGHVDDPAMATKAQLLSNGRGDKDVTVDSTLAEQVSTVKLDEKLEKMDTEPSVNGSNGHEPESPSPMEDSVESLQLAEDLEILMMEKVTNIIEDLFEGQLQYQTTCLECESKTSRTENFMDLSLPVKMHREQDDLQQAMGDVSPEKEADDRADTLSLSWSFETFMAAEKLDGENKYRCELCGSPSEAERKVYFAKLPKNLTIHLKRFEYNSTGSGTTKVHTPILTPSHLKLNRFCTNTCENKRYKYEIYGIILHEGSALDSGHYVSYIKAPLDYPFLKECCLKENVESSTSPPESPSTEANSSDVKVVDVETPELQEREEQLTAAFAEFDHCLHWIKFNDSTVTVLTEEEVGEVFLPEKNNSLSPYLLFYKRTDIEHSKAPKPEKSTAEKQGSTKAESSDSPGIVEDKEEDISR